MNEKIAGHAVPLHLGDERSALTVDHFASDGEPHRWVMFTVNTDSVRVSFALNVTDLEPLAAFLLRRARSLDAVADHALTDVLRVNA